MAGLSVPLVTFAKWDCQDRDGRRTGRNTPCREFSHHPAHVAHFTAAFYTQSIQARPGAPEKAGPGHCPVQDVHGRTDPSNRRERLYTRRRRLHARIVNVRNDVHHKATTAIAKSAGLVVIEDLNVRGMMSNRRLARALAEAGISGFLGKLAYKCRWYGAELVRGSRWYPSSRLCSQCGHRNDSLTLSDRQGACPSCGAVNERDLNAALNLERDGFELPGAGRGDRVRPAMPALVCEASSESRFEAWPPAKLEYQISSDSE